MPQSVTVASIRTKIRQAADMETADEANDVVTDTELTSLINDGYRALYDIIANNADVSRFATSASVSSPWTLPSDCYRVLGVDLPNFWGPSQPYTATRFSFRERNRRAGMAYAAGYDAPTWRVQNGVIAWEPSSAAPTSAVTIWYVPAPAALASGGSFDAVNGWDEYVVAWCVVRVKEKVEEDSKPALLRLAQAEARVKANAARLVQEPIAVADIACEGAEAYYNA